MTYFPQGVVLEARDLLALSALLEAFAEDDPAAAPSLELDRNDPLDGVRVLLVSYRPDGDGDGEAFALVLLEGDLYDLEGYRVIGHEHGIRRIATRPLERWVHEP